MAGFSRFGAACKRLEEKYLNGTCVTERSAFELRDSVEFVITVPDTTIGAVMEVVSDDTGEVKRFPLGRHGERFSVVIPMTAICDGEGHGLYYYKYRIFTDMGYFDFLHRDDFSQCWGASAIFSFWSIKSEISSRRGYTAVSSIRSFPTVFSARERILSRKTPFCARMRKNSRI